GATKPGTVTAPEAPGTGVGTGPSTAPDSDEEALGEGASAPVLETPTEPTSRLARLRDRLSKSNTTLGRGLLTLLSRETLDEQTWEEVEDLLIMADLGVDPTTEIVDALRERVRVLGTRDPQALTELLREELVKAVDPTV